jgi:AraC family transcriptional regulator
MSAYPDLPEGARWNVAHVYYPAGAYAHPPAGLLQLRLIRRGSSYADIDLGQGSKRVFTRPGDLLLSLPDRPTVFSIAEGRELTLLQLEPVVARSLLQRAGGRELDDFRSLSRRPIREPLVAELLRRLEAEDFGSAEGREWAVGLILASLLGAARRLLAETRRAVLSYGKFRELSQRIDDDLARPWSVDALAAAADLPRRAFAAAFKEATGLPVRQYLLRRRAERAAALLRVRDRPSADPVE